MQKIITLLVLLCVLIGFAPHTSFAAAKQFGDDSLERVVSVEYPLPADYIPADLVRAKDFGIVTSKDPGIEEMQIRLAQDAGSTDKAANFPSRLRALMVVCEQEAGEVSRLGSGYRSFATQKIVYNNHRTDGQAAVPGTSEHQAGLAVDISVGGDWMDENSSTYQCFTDEAWKYGLILSYPKGNRYLAGRDIFEPWHWRYVGLESARLLHKYSKKDWPAEFLAKLHYFRWLDSHGMDENWDALRRAVENLIKLENVGDAGTRAYSARVSYLAERVTNGRTDIGARLAIEYYRFLAENALSENVAGLRDSTAMLAKMHASAEPRERVASKKLEKMVGLLRANVLGN